MERKKNKNNSTKVAWINSGGGCFRLRGGKIIKSNQRFLADPDQIPVGFRDIVQPIDSKELEKVEKKEEAGQENDYKIVSVEEGFFNVVDAKGKAVNEKPVDEKEVKKLLKSLK